MLRLVARVAPLRRVSPAAAAPTTAFVRLCSGAPTGGAGGGGGAAGGEAAGGGADGPAVAAITAAAVPTAAEEAAARVAAKAASVARLSALRAQRQRESDENGALLPGEGWLEVGAALAACEKEALEVSGNPELVGHELIAHSAMVAALRRLVETNPSKDPITPDLVPIPSIGQAAGNFVVQGPRAELAVPVKLLPLMLIEEKPHEVAVLSEIELVMRAWSEEQARRLFVLAAFMRLVIMVCICSIAYFFYKTWLATERRLRGVDNMPTGLRIGSVVYLDMSDNGRDAGRLVIGLLNENCPLYCEHFHRRCTGSGGDGESFRGLEMSSLMARSVALFGEGQHMTHDVEGYDPTYLPTEWLPDGAWRGALSSVAYSSNKESPNFAIHLAAGDFTPQVFGLVMAGFEVIEAMSDQGTCHGCQPKHTWTVVGCGELCTLDKSRIVPLPWRLYDTISRGYDAAKFGAVSTVEVPHDTSTTTRPRLLHPMPNY